MIKFYLLGTIEVKVKPLESGATLLEGAVAQISLLTFLNKDNGVSWTDISTEYFSYQGKAYKIIQVEGFLAIRTILPGSPPFMEVLPELLDASGIEWERVEEQN